VSNAGEVFGERGTIINLVKFEACVDECLEDRHTRGGEAGVVDRDVGKEELIIVIGVTPVEHARVVNALGHASIVQQELVVLDFPDAACVAAARHVADDEKQVRGAVWAVAVEVGWHSSIDKPAAVLR